MHSTALSRSFTVTLAGYAAGAAWLFVPQIASSGKLPNLILIAFLLPTTAAVLLWLFYAIESRRPVCAREPGDSAATERILLRIIVFICGLHGLVLLQLVEVPWVRQWAPELAFVLVGGLLVSVGNLLPTTRPNALVGIRTPRSLRSRRFWMEINRFGGYVSVALGLVLIAAAAFLPFEQAGRVAGVGLLTAVAFVVVRYHTLARGSTVSS